MDSAHSYWSVVTSSASLASVGANQFASLRLETGARSWEVPTVQSIDVWLVERWEEARYRSRDIPLLLSPVQEILLWQDLMRADLPDLFHSEAAAQLARRASSIVEEWKIPLNTPEWNDNADASYFRDWYKRFQGLCRRRGFITRCDLWRLVPAWLVEGVCCPREALFVGFNSPTPVLEELWNVLGDRAVVAEQNHRPVLGARAVVCEDFQQEVEMAARWAREAFERDPHQSLAIFVPDLESHRSLIERIFTQVFYPASATRWDRAGASSECAFHLAAKEPAEKHPLVAGALLLLELGRDHLQTTDAGAVLRCPFITGAKAERAQRAQADLALRRMREVEVSLFQMQRASANCPQLKPIWEAVDNLRRSCPVRQDLPSWREFFENILQAVRWPGDEPLTQTEEEAAECLRSALCTLGTLGLVSGNVTYGTALGHLRRILSTSGFETGDWSSPVQILDKCAVEGLECERALAIGLAEEMWSAARPATPLIPLKLQAACGVPCASAESVQAEHARIAAALFSVAPDMTASYSGRLSPFVRPYMEDSPGELMVWQGRLPRHSFHSVALEETQEGNVPVYRALCEARGGTGIVKAQSLCPFRAFAQYRLGADGPYESEFGFDPLQRGGFLHKALELAWTRLKTQAGLLSLSKDELQELAETAAKEAIEARSDTPFWQMTAQVEQERIAQLLFEWLDGVERSRTLPFTVEMVEHERPYELGGLGLKLRVDRIDRLENGRLVLIDYKSGETSRARLDSKVGRPEEPQLLIYAAALGREVEGVFFGQLKPRSLKLVGFSREPHLPGKKSKDVLGDGWDEFLTRAVQQVETIAQEFVAGRADVDPIARACDNCGMMPICRVREKGGGVEDGELD